MSFHRTNRTEYLRSGCKLCNKTLATLMEYFESIFDARVANGTLRKLRDEQVCVKACNEYRHELQANCHDKLKHLADGRGCKHSWRRDRNGSNHSGKSHERTNYRERKTDDRNCSDCKTPHKQPAKKPCQVHGPESI